MVSGGTGISVSPPEVRIWVNWPGQADSAGPWVTSSTVGHQQHRGSPAAPCAPAATRQPDPACRRGFLIQSREWLVERNEGLAFHQSEKRHALSLYSRVSPEIRPGGIEGPDPWQGMGPTLIGARPRR